MENSPFSLLFRSVYTYMYTIIYSRRNVLNFCSGGGSIYIKNLFYLILNINISHPLQKQQPFMFFRKSLKSSPMIFMKLKVNEIQYCLTSKHFAWRTSIIIIFVTVTLSWILRHWWWQVIATVLFPSNYSWNRNCTLFISLYVMCTQRPCAIIILYFCCLIVIGVSLVW